MTYETDFENMQILKEQLYASDKQHKYTETATDMCIDKQCIQKIRYIDTKTHYYEQNNHENTSNIMMILM